MVNEESEDEQVKSSGIDFYHAVKVDTHVHANRGMTSMQLFDFIQDKLRTEGNVFFSMLPSFLHCQTVVFSELKGEKNVTLRRAFMLLDLDPDNLSADEMAVKVCTILFISLTLRLARKRLKDLRSG